MPPTPPLWPLLTELAAVAVATIVLLAWGRRRGGGRPMPPTCGRCGYDVSQRPPGVDRCSECGADLTRRGAVRTHQRRVRLAVAAPTLALLLAAIAVFVPAAHRFPCRAWFAEHGRLAWVEALARHDHSANGDIYRTSWAARDPSARFYDHLLDLCADPAASWQAGGWDRTLWEAYADGYLARPQAERMAKQLDGSVTVTARSPVRSGDPLAVGVAVVPCRQQSPGLDLIWKVVVAAEADGPADLAVGQMQGQYGRGDCRATLGSAQWCPGGVKPGRHRVSVVVSRELQTFGTVAEPAIDPIITRATVTVDVLPPSSVDPTSARPDPSRGIAVARAVAVRLGRLETGGRLSGYVHLLAIDVDRAFTVSVVFADGHRSRLGQIAAPRGKDETRFFVDADPADVDRTGQAATLELVGDADALTDAVGLWTYWPGRITIPNVAVVGPEQMQADFVNNLPGLVLPSRVDAGR